MSQRPENDIQNTGPLEASASTGAESANYPPLSEVTISAHDIAKKSRQRFKGERVEAVGKFVNDFFVLQGGDRGPSAAEIAIHFGLQYDALAARHISDGIEAGLIVSTHRVAGFIPAPETLTDLPLRSRAEALVSFSNFHNTECSQLRVLIRLQNSKHTSPQGLTFKELSDIRSAFRHLEKLNTAGLIMKCERKPVRHAPSSGGEKLNEAGPIKKNNSQPVRYSLTVAGEKWISERPNLVAAISAEQLVISSPRGPTLPYKRSEHAE